jgi:hypothetical protein
MFINQTISRNPQAKQLYESLIGKSPNELRQYAENVAKGKGIDLKQFLNGYGIRY